MAAEISYSVYFSPSGRLIWRRGSELINIGLVIQNAIDLMDGRCTTIHNSQDYVTIDDGIVAYIFSKLNNTWEKA